MTQYQMTAVLADGGEATLGADDESAVIYHEGGEVTIQLAGTPGGASFGLQYSGNLGTNYSPVTAGLDADGDAVLLAITVACTLNLKLAAGYYKGVTTGGSGTALKFLWGKTYADTREGEAVNRIPITSRTTTTTTGA